MHRSFPLLRAVAWCGLIVALTCSPFAAGTAASPAAALAASSCAWGYYPGGSGAFASLQNDAAATSPSVLRTGAFFRAAKGPLAANGALDFNGDGKSDLFRITSRPDSFYQWQFSSGGTAVWANLAYDSAYLNRLLFGDFNGDGKTDVFTTVYDSGAKLYRWYVSSGGSGSYVLVNSVSGGTPYDQVGDFNGDGTADIFSAVETAYNSGIYQWRYSSGATQPFTNLAVSSIPLTELRLGDFDGDGKTDVFAAVDQGNGRYQWKFSSGGAQTFQNLALTTHGLADLAFGDFDGDGTTDVFAETALPDGHATWAYWRGGRGQPVTLRIGPAVIPFLGDFNGDGKADALVADCGTEPHVTRLPTSQPGGLTADASYVPFIGDVNGDGKPDLIWSSICQGADTCVSGQNLVTVALGDGHGGFRPAQPQVLDTGQSWPFYTRYLGDVNGDGKTDMLFIEGVNIYTAISSGTKLSLSGPISLGSGLDSYNSGIGDFNGDGKADIVLNTVCLVGTGLDSYSCRVGSENNVYIALSNGTSFALGPQQSLGNGWSNYKAYLGDVNGDGKTDLIWNSTCQDAVFPGFDCDVGDGNYVYVGLSNGNGGITLSAPQTYGTSGWKDYRAFTGDFNGDGRTDMAWYAACPDNQHCDASSPRLRIGLANPDGTFQVSTAQTLPVGDWWNWQLQRGDMNGDKRDDLIWTQTLQTGPTTSRLVRIALSNGNGTFTLQPAQRVSAGFIPGSGIIQQVGDLTGDRRPDLLWYNGRTGQLDVLLNGNATSRTFVPLLRR